MNDFVAEAKKRAEEKGTTYAAAASQLARERPELHKAYLETCRARASRQRREANANE